MTTATILIVSDAHRPPLAALLQREAYRTLHAIGGAQAQALAAQCAPDLIVLDMPGMDACRLASQLKADSATASISLIMVTPHTESSARLAGLAAGVDDFLMQPVDRAELCARVRNLLRLKVLGDLQKHNVILERQVQVRTAELQSFRVAMDATTDAIMLVQRSTMRFVEVNAVACTMLGYTREELFQSCPSQLSAATLEQLATLYDATIAGHTANALTEIQIRRKDGSHLQVEVDRQAQRSGADWIIVGVLRDISVRKEVEQRRHDLAQLHLSEVSGQAAILNALPVHVALLDGRGVIISVNQAWRRFASENANQDAACGIGLNYLDMWDHADDAGEAGEAAAGIRSVLAGAAKNFTLEYPCHSPTEQRWYLMTVTPLGQNHASGALIMHQDVTARHQSEENLRASESLFRHVVENIRDVFFLRNLDISQIHYISPGYEKMWGRTCASLYANPRSWMEAIHPDDLNYVFKQQAANTSFDHEFRIVRPDGELRWIHVRGFQIQDSSGNFRQLAGFCSDITGRKRVAQILHESERRFRELLSNVELLAVMFDRAMRITFCNQYLLDLTGWRHEEVIGRDWFELFVPPEKAYLKEGLVAVFANLAGTMHLEYEILTRSGERRLIRWNRSVLRSELGDAIGIASIGEDVTKKRKYQESLRQSEELTRLIIESALDAVVVIDATDRITEWNPQAEKTFGWSRAEVIGTSLTDTIVPVRYREMHRQGLRKFLQTGVGSVINKRRETSALHRDGHEFSVELSVSPVRVGESWIFSSFFFDLTERKQAEQHLHDLNATLELRVIERTIELDARLAANTALAESLCFVNAQLSSEIDERQRAQEAQRASEAMMQVREAQSSRLEAVGTMAAGIAHDFNTILGIINGYAELLSDDFIADSNGAENVRQIIASSFRARDLIVRMLAFARQRPIDPIPLEAVALVRDILKMMRVMLPYGINMKFETDLQHAWMVADPSQIHQIVMNLCTNAADAMHGQGTLDIAIRRSPPLLRDGFSQSERFCLIVADNGCGMPPEVQQRVFDPFYTTKEPGKGSGLGLSVIYGIVSDLRGEIAIESQVGAGTRFTIHLPLLAQEPSGVALE